MTGLTTFQGNVEWKWKWKVVQNLNWDWERILPRASLPGQVGTNMNDVVGDDPKPDPAPDAVDTFIERSPQPMPAFENADSAFAAGAPFLKLLEPSLLLPLFAGRALGVMARNRYLLDAHLLGLGFVSGGKESGVRRDLLRRVSELFHMLLQTSFE